MGAGMEGRVEQLSPDTKPRPSDRCLVRNGLNRGLDDGCPQRPARLGTEGESRIACDLPSGVDSDDGASFSRCPIRPHGHLRRTEARAPADARRCQMRPRRACRHRHRRRDAIGTRSAMPTLSAARSLTGTNIPAGWSMRSPARCPGAIALAATAAARSGAGYVRVSRRGRSTACPRQSSRPTRRTSTTSASAASWSGPGWATFRRC